ncbi:hypothetical protein K1T71_014389 [Dendrolimus kikuchii]|uniref:Uncharacterized protein n=1 Tax=Dendrolimus kikuchii TaxID=765133 RepID=A0ACC1CE42_9NEOP|nr:hypothetical protein K1T71_014389 [Dendrolimus kikuchii]
MSFVHNISHKKKTSTAYKEKLLKELEYYDRRLKEFRNINNTPNESYDSSDSENDLPLYKPLQTTEDVLHLKTEQESITTCLNATQELTGLTVLESEISLLSENPVFADKLTLEPGVWKEVLAECRVDLVPISISFYLHQPHRKFAPPSFHALRVALVKAAHETELNASILNTAKTPSEVIEVIKNYSTASRSRKATLAKLAGAFSTLYMEPMDGGGYKLKCADIIEICWRLENNVSTVAPFRHKLKFDLEYLDESHLRPIKEAYKQLSYPKLDTDERTLLLAKIIKICLKAKPTDGVDTVQEVPEANNLMETNMAEVGVNQANVNTKKKSGENQTQNKEDAKNIEQKKKKQNQKIFKENHERNSEKLVNNKQKVEKSTKNQKVTVEDQQKSTEEISDAHIEEHMLITVQNKNDVNKKQVVEVENNRQRSKDNTKSISKKSSEVQKTKEIKRSEVNKKKAIENINAKQKDLPKTSKEVDLNKENLPTKVQKEKVLKGKAENTNKDGEVKITNEMQKEDLSKTSKEIISNKEKIHTKVRKEKVIKRRAENTNRDGDGGMTNEIQEENLAKISKEVTSDKEKLPTNIQKEEVWKKKATNNNKDNIEIGNDMQKGDLPKASEEVTVQKELLSKEVQKEKTLKRKAENTNKQTEVKKSKKSSQIMESNKNTATTQISKQTNKGMENKTNGTNLKITKSNNMKEAVKKVKTVTKSQSETNNQKDLVTRHEDRMSKIENNLDSVNNKSANIESSNIQKEKNTDNLKNNNNKQQAKKDIEKNSKSKFIAITKRKSIGPKNKLSGTKLSKTKIKAGNIVEKISKPQSKEQMNKVSNQKINSAGNPESTTSGVAYTNKVNLDKPKKALNSENNTDNEIPNKYEKNQISLNTVTKKSNKHVASNQNKNLPTTKILFKDRIVNSKEHTKDKFQKTLTNKTHANMNLASKLKKTSDIVQNGGTSKIPQKKMSPGLKKAMKYQTRKSPRNLTKMIRKPEKLVSSIPRIIKPVKPHQ